MNTIIKNIVVPAAAAFLLCGCESALDPMPNGHYTDENIDDYPSLMRGFIGKAYDYAEYTSYCTAQHIYLDCATDDGVLTSVNSDLRKMATGALSASDDPFETYWTRDYLGIYYVNRFLKDNVGLNTQYLVDQDNDKIFRRDLQGDAFALRAWFEYDLLLKFGGCSESGEPLGYVIIDRTLDQANEDVSSFKRATFAECARQILKDCDSALVYLPLANRDWAVENTTVEGSQRWGKFDQVSITALKALTCQLWASPAFNKDNDVTLWENAAKYAYEAMQFKLQNDFPKAGVNALSKFSWNDPNTPECYLPWRNVTKSTTYEKAQYPAGFRGGASYAPSQELVDAFPMANGYPITDSRSGYNPQKPYENRDPRFYADIFYNGAKVIRSGKTEVMYTFECFDGGKDRKGLTDNSLTGYYLKKFIYTGWNANDLTVQTMPHSVLPITWRDMVFAFAEAANNAYGPTDSRLGISAKDALAYIRNRTTTDGEAGLGTKGDPYLDECAASQSAFETLLRNERRIEFCFEGKRFHDLKRWNVSLEERNKDVHAVSISENGVYDYSEVIYTIKLGSKYLPMPYKDVQRTSGVLVQNEGWSSWGVQ